MPVFDAGQVNQLCGWIDHPRRHVVAALFGRLRNVAPRMMATAPTGDILLYRAWSEVLGGEPPYKGQTIGDCVSHGHGHANDLLQCVEMALSGSGISYRETLTEFIYGSSRKMGGMLGPQDGSVGSFAIKAMKEVGMLPREAVPNGDYDGRRAKAWGATGPPPELESEAQDFKLGSAALVETWDELVVAIGNGYPVTICSDQGFSMSRNSEAICEAQGTWNHCMGIAGIIEDTAVIYQSWGAGVPDGPLVHDMPSFSFRARKSVVERVLSQGDSWALSKTPAFASRPLPASWSYRSFV